MFNIAASFPGPLECFIVQPFTIDLRFPSESS